MIKTEVRNMKTRILATSFLVAALALPIAAQAGPDVCGVRGTGKEVR